MDGRAEYPGLDGRGLLAAAAGLPHPSPSPGAGLMSTAFAEAAAARRQLSELGRASSLPQHYSPRYLPPSMALHGPRSSYLMGGYLSPAAGSGPGPAGDPFKSPLAGHGLPQYWSPASTSAGADGFGRYMPGVTAGPSSVYSPYLPLLGSGDTAGLPLFPQTPALPPHHQPYHRIYDLHKEALLAGGVAGVSPSGELLPGSTASSSAAAPNSSSRSSKQEPPGSDRVSRSHSGDTATRKLGSGDTKSTVTIKSETESGVKGSHRDHNGHGQDSRHSSDGKAKYVEGSVDGGSSRRSKRTECGSKESSSHKDSSAGAISRKVVSPCDNKVKTESSTEQCPHKKAESNSHSLDRTSSSPGSKHNHHKTESAVPICLHSEKNKSEPSDARSGVSDMDQYNRSQDGALCLTVKPKSENRSPPVTKKADSSCRAGGMDCDVASGDIIRTQSVSTTTVTTITACTGAGSTVVTSTSPDGGVYSMYPSSKPLMSTYLPAGMTVSAEGKTGKSSGGPDYLLPYYQPGISFPHQQISQEGRKVHATTFTPEVGTLPSATLTTSSVSSSGSKSSPPSGLDTRTKLDSGRVSGEHSRHSSIDSVHGHTLPSREMKSPTNHSLKHHQEVDTKPKVESLPSLPRTSSGGHVHISQERLDRDIQREHSGQAINLSLRQDHRPSSATLPNPWPSARPSSRSDPEDKMDIHATSHGGVGYMPLNVPYRDIIHEPRYPGGQAGPGPLRNTVSHGDGDRKAGEMGGRQDLRSPTEAQRRVVYDWGNSPYPPLGPGHMAPLPGPRGYLLPYDPMLHLQGMQSDEERRRLVEAGLLPRHLVMCDSSATAAATYPRDQPSSSMVSPPSGSSKPSPRDSVAMSPDQSSHAENHPAIGVAMETKMIHTVEGIQPQIGQVYTVNAPVITAGGQMIKVDAPTGQPGDVASSHPTTSSDVKPLILPGAPLQVMSHGKYPQQFVVAPPYGLAAAQASMQIIDSKEGPTKSEDTPTTSGVNIPVGIAVARQRQEKTATKKESTDGESTSEEELLEGRHSEDAWSHHSPHELKDRAEFLREQKSLLTSKRTSSGSRDGRPDLGSNLVVTGGTSCSGGPQWQESEARNTTAGHPAHLGGSWMPPGHPHPLGPGLWLGPGHRCTYPPPGVTGSVDPTHLPMPAPPGGVKLAQDPLTGQLFLIPDWPTYGSSNPPLPPSHQLQLMAQYSQLQQQQQQQAVMQQQQQQQQQPPQPKPELMATVAPLQQTQQHKDSEVERDKIIRKTEQRGVRVSSRVSPPRRPIAPAAVAPRIPSPTPPEPSPAVNSPSPHLRQPQNQSPHRTMMRTGSPGGSTVDDSGSVHEQAGPSGADKHGAPGQPHPFLPGVSLPAGQPYPLPYPHHLPYFYDPNLVQLRPLGADSMVPARAEGSTRSQGTSPITMTTAKTTSTATATVSMATTGTATDSLEVKPLRSISTASVQTSTSPDADLLRASVKEQSIQTNGPSDVPMKVLCPTVKTEKPCVIVESSVQADMPTLEKKVPHSVKDLDLLCKDSDSRKSVSPLPPTLIPEGDPTPRTIPDNIPDIDHFKQEIEDSPPPVMQSDTEEAEPVKTGVDLSSLDSDALQVAGGLELLSMLAERAEKQAVPEGLSQPLSPAPPPAPVLAPRRATLLDLHLPDLELEFKDFKSDPDSENSSFRCTDSPDINRNYNAPKMCFSGDSSPADKKDNPFGCLRQFSPKKESALGQFASSVFKIPTSVDNMDAMELEMRMRLAELQRRYKEKQRELARLQPKREKDDDRLQVKRGPGRPRKRKFSKKNSKHDRSPTKCMKLESGMRQVTVAPGKGSSGIKKKSSSSTLGKEVQRTPKKLNTSAFQSPKTTRPVKVDEKETPVKKPVLCKPSSTKKKSCPSPTAGTVDMPTATDTTKAKVKVKVQPKPEIHVQPKPEMKTEDSPTPSTSQKITAAPSKKVTPSKPVIPKPKAKLKKVELPQVLTASPPRPQLPPPPPPPVSTLREYDFPDDDEDEHMLGSSDDSDIDDMKWFDEVKNSKQLSLDDPWATSSTGSSGTHDSYDDYCESGGLNVLAKYASSEMGLMHTSVAAATSAALKSKKRKKRPDDTGMDEFDDVPVKKRKPGRPKKCGSEDSGITETIVAKKPKKLHVAMMAALTQESKDVQKDVKKSCTVKPKSPPKDEPSPKPKPKPAGPPVFLDEEWGRRRSERIFLNDPNTCVNNNDVLFKASEAQKTPPAVTPSSSSTVSVIKTNKPTSTIGGMNKPKVIKDKPKTKTTMMQDLSQKVKKKYAKPPISKPCTPKPVEAPPCSEPTKPCPLPEEKVPEPEPKKEDPRPVEPECDSDGSSDGDNVPLSRFIERATTPEPRNCVIDKEELKDGVRVLFFMEGLFFEGQVKAIQPPDVYGVVIDGERGSRPHILSLEELLNDAVIDVKPPSPRYLSEGTRVCAYWSQQFSCLYPGTVAKGSPNPNADKHLICVEFDDGDSGRIPIEHIRMLPQDFPVVNMEPNPIMFLGKRRRRTTSEELIADTKERKPSLSDTFSGYPPSDESKQKRRGPGRPPKRKGSEEEPMVSSNSKTVSMPTIDESQHTAMLPERDPEDKPDEMRCLAEPEELSTPKVLRENLTPLSLIPQQQPTTAPTVVKKKHKHKDRDREKVKKDKSKSSGQGMGQEYTKHKHHHKKHKDKDKNREKSKEKKHKKHSSSSVSSASDSVSSPRSAPTTPVLTSNSSTNTEPSAEGLFASLAADLAKSPQTSSVGTNTSTSTITTPSTARKPEVTTPKRSDLTMRIRTNSGEYNRADFTQDLREETEESQDSASVSMTDKSQSNQSSDIDNSGDECPVSDVEDMNNEKQVELSKKSKPALQKQTSSSGSKKKRDRLPSVENRSKIAAFLPARQLWRWSGKSTKRPGMKGRAKKEFYKAITRGKETIRVGDCAVFLSTGRPNLPYVGRIESLWEAWGGNMVVKVKWFYHPEETKGGKRLLEVKGALYQSPHVDENDVQTISHKCELLPYPTYKTFRHKEAQDGREYDGDVYYLAGTYDPTIGMITFEKDVKLLER